MKYIIFDLFIYENLRICKRNYFGEKESKFYQLVRIFLLEKLIIFNILLGIELDIGMVVLMYFMKLYNCYSVIVVLFSFIGTLVSWIEWEKVLNLKLKKYKNILFFIIVC